jgi:hypothetical protein
MPYTNYIDIFNEGRDADRPLVTLYDDESIRFFFDHVLAGGELYKKYFESGKIAMVSFSVHQDMQTGTGYYAVKDGKIDILSETGMMAGILQRVQYDRIAQKEPIQQDQATQDDTARTQRYAEYLQQTLQRTRESGDPHQEAEAILQYHQAILEVAAAIEPADTDAGKMDLVAFRARAAELEHQRQQYAQNLDSFGPEEMKAFILACLEGLRGIEQLSAEAQAQIQRTIVIRFYDIRHPIK